MRLRILSIVMLLAVLLAACGSNDDGNTDDVPEASELIQDAAEQIDAAKSYLLELNQDGAIALIDTNVIEAPIAFDSADAVFVEPDRIAATVTVTIGAAAQEIELVAVSERQYISNTFLTSGDWQQLQFARDFVPQDLYSEEFGIGSALRTMQDIEMIGRKEVDGVPVYQVRGKVEANRVRSVTVGLIGTREGLVDVDAYFRTRDSRLAQLVLTEPVENEGDEASVWTIKFAGYNNDNLSVDEPSVAMSE